MKIFLLILVCLCLSCTKVEILRDVPDCIETKIREFAKATSTCDSGAEINEHLFQGVSVFTFSEGNCGSDAGAQIFNSNCDYIGYLGGIANLREVNGENFADNAKFIAKIWGN